VHIVAVPRACCCSSIASHECVRIPMWIAQTVDTDIALGTTAYVYA
jgi:hypothetical protein